MENFTSEDLIKALESKCNINNMGDNITVRKNNISIVIEYVKNW